MSGISGPWSKGRIISLIVGVILVGVCIYLFAIQTRLRRYQF